MTTPCLVWFRRDLRLSDNPALTAAVASGRPVLGVFVLEEGGGAASRWWLHGALEALAEGLRGRGGALILRRGDPAQVLGDLACATGAEAVLAARSWGPEAATEARVAAALAGLGVSFQSYAGLLLHDPERLTTRTGTPYGVFTPFWNTLVKTVDPGRPEPAPARVPAPPTLPTSERLEDWALRPRAPDWAGGLRAAWTPGEAAAQARLDAFVEEGLETYADLRDRPDRPATSRLAPSLAWGEVSPRQIWSACQMRPPSPGREGFLRQLGWREFCYHGLHRFPAMAECPLKAPFARFPWAGSEESHAALARWRRGLTGYPLVDAGMRELWATGWMHNRVRMVVASFLVKHLLVDWRAGLAWFHDTLVDADPANNPGGWQWVAGCGSDAAPYFRIFNPVTQAERFDPEGAYVRRWVPELARLPAPLIHRPWTASPLDLAAAGIRLGQTYPRPQVDHAQARARALAALASLDQGKKAQEKQQGELF